MAASSNKQGKTQASNPPCLNGKKMDVDETNPTYHTAEGHGVQSMPLSHDLMEREEGPNLLHQLLAAEDDEEGWSTAQPPRRGRKDRETSIPQGRKHHTDIGKFASEWGTRLHQQLRTADGEHSM
jgi:hypothetical protein